MAGWGFGAVALGKAGREFSRLKKGHVQSEPASPRRCKNNPFLSTCLSPQKINRI